MFVRAAPAIGTLVLVMALAAGCGDGDGDDDGVNDIPTPARELMLDEPLAGFVDAIGMSSSDSLRVDVEPLRGEVTIYTIEGVRAGLTFRHLDLKTSFAARLTVPPDAAASIERQFTCDALLASCTSAGFPVGDVLLVGGIVDAPIPLQDQQHAYFYSAALQDGDPSNNYEPGEPYNWDFYLGMDFFIERIWLPGEEGWRLEVSTMLDGVRDLAGVNTWSVIYPPEGESSRMLYAFFVSEEDLRQLYPGRQFRAFRMTTFGTDPLRSAEPEVSGGDVSGIDPTEPPLLLPEDRVRLAPSGAGTPEPPDESQGEGRRP